MSNQFLKLRRSAVPGRVPTTSSLDLGEIAVNTYDGVAYMKRSSSFGEDIIAIGPNTSSVVGQSFRIPVFDQSNSIISSTIYQKDDFTSIRNSTGPDDPSNPDILYVNGDGISTYNLISAHGNINNYVQLNIQNYNAGPAASSDIVATSDNGTESYGYINMGINSSNFVQAAGVGTAGDAYVYSTGNDLYIGNATADKQVIIFNGSADAANQARVWIHNQGTVGINTGDFDPLNPPSLQIQAPNNTTYNLMQVKGDVDNYSQVGILNINNGINASSDLALYNNVDPVNQLAGYVDLGINSTNYAANEFYPGKEGDAYLFTDSHHLVLGTLSGSEEAKVTIFAGGVSESENAKLVLFGSNQHKMSGSLDISGSLIVRNTLTANDATGSLYGTSSWALHAISASYIPASGVEGLSLSKIVSGSVTASVNVNESAFTLQSGSETLFDVKTKSKVSHGYNVSASGLYSHAEGYGYHLEIATPNITNYELLINSGNESIEPYTGFTTFTADGLTSSFSLDGGSPPTLTLPSTNTVYFSVYQAGFGSINVTDPTILANINVVSSSYNSGTDEFSIYFSPTMPQLFTFDILTEAKGVGSHAEGNQTIASGSYSHTEGANTYAYGPYSHAEGSSTLSYITGSHVEGNGSIAGSFGYSASIASGVVTLSSVYGDISAYFDPSATGYIADTGFLLGYISIYDNIGLQYYANVSTSVFNGTNTVLTLTDNTFNYDTAFVSQRIYNNYGTANTFLLNSDAAHAEGLQTVAGGYGSHAEGFYASSMGVASHAEGYYSVSAGDYSHAEGENAYAMGIYSHAEGDRSITIGRHSHAEGEFTRTYGFYSHAEGFTTRTYGNAAHAEGAFTTASGDVSHTEGEFTVALARGGHAEGYATIASGSYQHVQGKYNKQGNSTSLMIIGNGTSNANRSDLALFNQSSIVFSSSLQVTNGVTGSLLGTSSYSLNSLSSSYATTASYVISSSYSLSSSYAVSSSNAISSSLSLNANTSSFVNYVTGSAGDKVEYSIIRANDSKYVLTTYESSTVGSDHLYISTRNLNWTGSSIGSRSTGQIVAIGSQAMQYADADGLSRNGVAIGAAALRNLRVGVYNVGVGVWALEYLTNGRDNVAVGEDAGGGITTGSFNTYLGAQAGYGNNQVTASHTNVIAIGYRSLYSVPPVPLSNTTVIGTSLNTSLNNVVLLGRSDQNVLIGAPSADNGAKLQVLGSVSASAAVTAPSFTGSLFGTSSWAVSSSNSLTASYVSNAFIQNGNTFGTAAVIGTNDSNALVFEVNNTEAGRFQSSSGNFIAKNSAIIAQSVSLGGTITFDNTVNGIQLLDGSSYNSSVLIGNNNGSFPTSGVNHIKIGQTNSSDNLSSRVLLLGWSNDVSALSSNDIIAIGYANEIGTNAGDESPIVLGVNNTYAPSTTITGNPSGIQIGANLTATHQNTLLLGYYQSSTADGDLIIAQGNASSNTAGYNNVYFGTGPRAVTLSGNGSSVSINGSGAGIGSNLNGGDLTLAGGKGTGTGTGGDINFKVPLLGSSGATLQSLGNTTLRIKSNTGNVLVGDSATDDGFTLNVKGSTKVSSNLEASGSIRLSGSLSLLGSTSFTGSVNSLNGYTGSLYGTSSWAINVLTASYIATASWSNNAVTASYIATSSWASKAITASYIATASYVATSSWAVNSITASYALTGNGTFSGSFSGSFTGSLLGTSSWSVSSSRALNSNNASTASYVLNAVSSSYAATASSANAFYVRENLVVNGYVSMSQVLYSYSSATTSAAPTVAVTLDTGSRNAVFFDYVVKYAANTRCGTIMTAWNGSNIDYANASTVDIGDTSEVTFYTDLYGSSVRLVANPTVNSWDVKVTYRAI